MACVLCIAMCGDREVYVSKTCEAAALHHSRVSLRFLQLEADDSAPGILPVLVVECHGFRATKERFDFKMTKYAHNKLNVSLQIK